MMRPPRDKPARDRIRTDLATNLLVEAGAGSGKTTSLVERMIEHVRTGTPVERLTAVTFMRKAANELRERFQIGLERAARAAEPGGAEAMRYERALRELDRAFLGTIHSFCARLLRERPLEAGLDPRFSEVSEEDWDELKARFWRRFSDRLRRERDSDLVALRKVGIEPSELFEGFNVVMTYPDVEFPLGDGAVPDIAVCRGMLDRVMTTARQLMPTEEPEGGWDDLMKLVRRLEFRRGIGDWSNIATFCDVIGSISKSNCKPVQKRWSETREGKADAKALGESFEELLTGVITDVLRCWREHRYPIVMRVLRRAAEEFERERHATGRLGFEDLLLLCARLLREHPAVRDELGERYAHLLVDEFQDTDPIQAEVCFLLASDSSQGSDWRAVVPRPGSLFVVGDPKQSIYRFRRADIQVYELVKRRMQECGAVLSLTTNFRSVSAVEAVVNGHFARALPEAATAEQAAYSPMETVRDPEARDGVYRYVIEPDGRAKDDILELDAAAVASWIARRIVDGQRSAGDFLILTATKEPIAFYARALAERNVPVATTGARLPQEHELRELLVVLRALADPEHAIAIVAALEGLFFGLSPAELWDGSRLGIRFAITHPPADDSHVVGRALRRLHEWWRQSQRHPADALLERILEDTGLLFHAASQPLGDARAGALLHLVQALRASSVSGAAGIADAMERVEVLLAAEAPDSPLRPGRTDAVRVMNLHKAKGLEAEVVVLAAPCDDGRWEPRVHVTRGSSDRSTGGVCIGHKSGRQFVPLAHPPGWDIMQAAEQRFQDAERIRLLYVAATRAKRELVVAQAERQQLKGPRPDVSMWRPLAPTLAEHALSLQPVIIAPAGRRPVGRSAAALREVVQRARTNVEGAALASFRVRSITELAKRCDDQEDDIRRARGRADGAAWGRAVHRTIEALGRGRRGARLAAFARAVAHDEELSAERATALEQLAHEFEDAPLWRELVGGSTPLTELRVMHSDEEEGVVTYTEGVIDVALHGEAGWQVVDWKSDAVDDAEWTRRLAQYERQVAGYASALAKLTGENVRTRVERVRA